MHKTLIMKPEHELQSERRELLQRIQQTNQQLRSYHAILMAKKEKVAAQKAMELLSPPHSYVQQHLQQQQEHQKLRQNVSQKDLKLSSIPAAKFAPRASTAFSPTRASPLAAKKLTEALLKTNQVVPSYDESTRTYGGLPVSEFRLPKRTSKAPKNPFATPTLTSNEVDPSPITNKNIIRIRHDQARLLATKNIIKTFVQNIEIKKIKLEEKKERNTRHYPKINVPESMLPNRYIRGELPCTIEHGINGHYLSWACPLEDLDYEYYLPLFFDGLQCKSHPSNFLAQQGIEDLLLAAQSHPERVIPCLHSLVRPLRNALNKFDPYVLLAVLKALQKLVLCHPDVGIALTPFSKQFLAPIAAFMDVNRNIGDSIDYGQRKGDDIGEEVRKTLELMEERGGPDAFESIKFSVPLYQSCVRKPDSHHQKRVATAAPSTSGSKRGSSKSTVRPQTDMPQISPQQSPTSLSSNRPVTSPN